MGPFLSQLKWQLLLLARNNLINISIAVTFMYALIFYFIKDLPNIDKFLTLLIFNDPVIICLFFVGVSIIMEKNDGVLPAIFVSPVTYHVYLLAKVVALSIVGWACATGMTLAMLGPDLSWIPFSIGIISTCAICGIVGIYLVSYASEFLNFTLRSIPVMLFLSLPMLNYFELTNNFLFDLTPMYGPLQLIVHGYSESADLPSLWLVYGSTLFWMVVLYWGGYRIFKNRIVNAIS